MCSVKKAVLKSFAIFTGKHLCWSHFLIKLQAFRKGVLRFVFAWDFEFFLDSTTSADKKSCSVESGGTLAKLGVLLKYISLCLGY